MSEEMEMEMEREKGWGEGLSILTSDTFGVSSRTSRHNYMSLQSDLIYKEENFSSSSSRYAADPNS